ncbi:alanine--tRNA ligase [Chloroflexi bacterium TSY]|nr:alanine--tRNA ligase [Chloroflexi bacterium TSY]
MNRLSADEIRQLWFDYFSELNHTIVESGNLVPNNDPTLLFANSGMVQFKDALLGLEDRGYKRAVTSQKSMRVSGKHNDLEEVGPSPRHHTFFEMLGNFSFGDYFKKEAIQWAWHFLVHVLELPVERLWFSIYKDDDESEKLWIEAGAAPERVLRFGAKDNWWSMGETGPCGPNSEIHYYWGDLDKMVPEGVNRDDEYLEIWNLVFMQYDQKPDGTLVPLPNPGVDTGAGLERIARILQNKENNYETDLFGPIMDQIRELSGHSQAEFEENLYRYRAIADHARAITFLIGDGVLPGNEGRNYVLRLVLRRSARFGKLLGFDEPFLAKIAQTVIDLMGHHYTDLPDKRDFILQTITAEEERFHRTLSIGLERLDDLIQELQAKEIHIIPGADAFFLWDTFGFPLDITRDIAEENGLTVDVDGYQEALVAQKEKSRAATSAAAGIDVSVYVELLGNLKEAKSVDEDGIKHLIYENLDETDSKVVGLLRNGELVSEAYPSDAIEVVLPETPFYVESGGQVSDTGEIYYFPENVDKPVWTIDVTDARRPIPGLLVHVGTVTSGTVKLNDEARATIDTERRWDIMRNHTGTHVLHSALRKRLGKHVRQAGSLVAPERLRFDFTHTRSLSKEELGDIEQFANDITLANFDVNTRWTTYDQAVSEGAMALFGEKYGDEVRVVSFGEQNTIQDTPISMELCGGTHVDSTAEIGNFRIVSEGSVAAGVRRIEVVTGRMAEQLVEERFAAIETLSELLRTQPDDLIDVVKQLQEQAQQAQKEVAQLRQKLARDESETLLGKAQSVNDISVLAVSVDAGDVNTMRQMTDWFRDKLGSSVITVGSVIDNKPMLVAAVTDDLIGRGMHAGNLVSSVAKIMGGGGGGRPNMAQAGGKDVEKLDDALASVPNWVQENLK